MTDTLPEDKPVETGTVDTRSHTTRETARLQSQDAFGGVTTNAAYQAMQDAQLYKGNAGDLNIIGNTGFGHAAGVITQDAVQDAIQGASLEAIQSVIDSNMSEIKAAGAAKSGAGVIISGAEVAGVPPEGGPDATPPGNPSLTASKGQQNSI